MLSSASRTRAASKSKMPPQQPDRLLDLIDHMLDFCAHGSPVEKINWCRRGCSDCAMRTQAAKLRAARLDKARDGAGRWRPAMPRSLGCRPYPYSNAPDAGTPRPSRCRPMPAVSFLYARAAARRSSPCPVTAACFVPTAPCPVRPGRPDSAAREPQGTWRTRTRSPGIDILLKAEGHEWRSFRAFSRGPKCRPPAGGRRCGRIRRKW